MTDLLVIIFLIVLLVVESAFGSHFGYTVNGVPQAGTISQDSPGILGALQWVWDSVGYMFDMLTFRIDGMPALFSYVTIIVCLVVVILIVRLIRGTG